MVSTDYNPISTISNINVTLQQYSNHSSLQFRHRRIVKWICPNKVTVKVYRSLGIFWIFHHIVSHSHDSMTARDRMLQCYNPNPWLLIWGLYLSWLERNQVPLLSFDNPWIGWMVHITWARLPWMLTAGGGMALMSLSHISNIHKPKVTPTPSNPGHQVFKLFLSR